MKKLLLLGILFSGLAVYASGDYYYPAYYENNYCTPQKTSFVEKLKNAFIGTPTGYTPQIAPSPFINTYGPSYMRGFYGSNGWNDHNVYRPTFTSSMLQMLNN